MCTYTGEQNFAIVVHPVEQEGKMIMPRLLSLHVCRVNTVELQWLEHLWNHENMFETGVVRANES